METVVALTRVGLREWILLFGEDLFMNLEKIRLELRGAQTGISLFDGDFYVATYRSLNDCILDLAYHFRIEELDGVIKAFSEATNVEIIEPFEYRGVCTEMFWPTNAVFSYVYYRNTLSSLFECFSFHEERAKKHDDYFAYGVQGTGIHRFNQQTKLYEFWVGGRIKTVSDIMTELKTLGKIIPKKLEEEFSDLEQIDVFISHKSQDYSCAKAVYDELIKYGKKLFLSEVSLPVMANTDYTFAIDNALEKAKGMIVIADSIEIFDSGWVHYEWSSFLNEKRSGRKNGNLITIVRNEESIGKLHLYTSA